MKKTVIVTGAGGFIGGETMLRLKDQGHMVIGVDLVACPDHLGSLADRFYQEDFSNPYALDLLHQFAPVAVVHCAGSSLVGPSLGRPAAYYHNNFVKTKKLLDHIVDNKINTRVIFSSSAACYGEPVINPCNEIDPCEPISPYGQSKLMIEWMLHSYKHAYNLDFVALRYFNACGADSQGRHGQKSQATHIIARVLEAIRDNKEFILNGDDYATQDGTCVRDYVHVEDIADAHIAAMNKDIPAGTYNLGTKQGISNREVIAMAEQVTGRKVKMSVGPRRHGDPAMLTASADRWYAVSGTRPRFVLDDMVAHAWRWYNR